MQMDKDANYSTPAAAVWLGVLQAELWQWLQCLL
jgi:hypothetical protein